MLRINRAVALAWVENPDPINLIVVNHIDGNPANNWYENLEWTDCSGNNYHAIASGLRRDNIPCYIRDFYTSEVLYFDSTAQAAEFMGFSKDTHVEQLYPKMFGKLVAGRYEFRFANDPTPWFYEGRDELIKPSRYMVTVEEQNGQTREVYSTASMLKEFQLYDAPSKAIPALAEHANKKYPDKRFVVRDSYTENRYVERRKTNGSFITPVNAVKNGNSLNFRSITECAEYFGVDRSVVQHRLETKTTLDGWNIYLSGHPNE